MLITLIVVCQPQLPASKSTSLSSVDAWQREKPGLLLISFSCPLNQNKSIAFAYEIVHGGMTPNSSPVHTAHVDVCRSTYVNALIECIHFNGAVHLISV